VPVIGVPFNGYMMYKLGWIDWDATDYLADDRDGGVFHL
jgi:hypothetical protein